MDDLVIERITIDESRARACCEATIVDPSRRYSSPELMAQLQKAHPDLPNHTCVNDYGTSFSAVMNSTSIPHVLEHLVIDLQAATHAQQYSRSIQSSVQSDKTIESVFVGTTCWVDEACGKALIEVSFTDDLVVLRAFRDASRILNDAMVE